MQLEQKLSDVLSEFARTMVTDFAIQSILDRLVERIVDVLPITAAGVTLISPGQRPAYVAASDVSALRFEQLQSELGHGPCVVAWATAEAVLIADLATDERFPEFSPMAIEAGLRAVFTLPLLHGDERLGALDLYRDVAGPLGSEAMTAARTLADVTSAYLINAQARAETQASEARYRSIVETAQEGFWIQDLAGVITFANPMMAAQLGTTVENVEGRSLLDFVNPADHPDARQLMTQRHLGVAEDYEFSLLRADATSLHVVISAIPLRDADGEVTGALKIVTDISAHKDAELTKARLELQRERNDKLASLGQLAGGIAHDFNNLLGVIAGYTDLIKREVTDERILADLEEVDYATVRAAALTTQLLAFARQDIVEPELIDVNSLITRFGQLLDRTLGEHIQLNLNLHHGTESDRLIVVADAKQLEQVLLNIAINARDAMPDGGSLMTTTELCTRNSAEQHATTWVRIRITDTGVGMPADVVARAFEPFFTTKPRGAGTGLGLASAYGIVTQNGGEIAIDSQPGHGTTIELMFPCHDAPTVPSQQTPTAVPPPRHERILLVEDEASLRRATERIIASFGYHVVAVSDGDEALAILDGAGPPIDLVITDIVMKRISGSDLANEIAKRHPRVPLIFMSGYVTPNTIPAGATVIRKPARRDTLNDAIRAALDHPSAE